MLTIKVINSNGDELLYEAMHVYHKASRNVIEYTATNGQVCAIDVASGKRIYVMNAEGATVGSYVKCTNLDSI